MSTKRAKQHAYLVKCEQYMKARNRQYSGGKSPYQFIKHIKHDDGFELINTVKNKNRFRFRWRNYWNSYSKRVTGDGNK